MKTQRLPVRINSDSTESIATLYGIGEKLANRIVQVRNEKGFFSNPDDLIQVEGISFELAITLSPHIDWTIPIQENQKQTRHWFWGILILFLAGLVVYPVFEIISTILNDVRLAFQPEHLGWFEFLQVVITPLGKIFASCMLLFSGMSNLATSSKNARRFVLAVLYSSLFWLIAKAFLAFSYFFLIPRMIDWTQLLTFSEFVIDWLLFITATCGVLPPFIAYLYPRVRQDNRFLLAYDILILIVGVNAGLLVWVGKNEVPIWSNLIILGVGIYEILLGVLSLRYKENLLEIQYGILFNENKLPTYNYWINWINSRLPDPQEQEALKSALDKIYPQTRTKTIINILLIGVGGWIVTTILGAVVQWFVEKGLNTLIH